MPNPQDGRIWHLEEHECNGSKFGGRQVVREITRSQDDWALYTTYMTLAFILDEMESH